MGKRAKSSKREEFEEAPLYTGAFLFACGKWNWGRNFEIWSNSAFEKLGYSN